jgi:hypothetical protein
VNPPTPGGCRLINNSNQQNQGGGGGIEDGITTVRDLIDFADQALSAGCERGGSCIQTCSTAFAPPDPVRIGEMAWALQAINECFANGGTLDTQHTHLSDCWDFDGNPPPTGCCADDAMHAQCCDGGPTTPCLLAPCDPISIQSANETCGACGEVCAPGTTCTDGHCL